eukprot:TRINITY_DN584_c1_g1_i1.p1 TRINITY_DN584_c1_g1~~TRINITY_DN584_c1_g1_i1.p1  ORF type:complete len:306 (-),score=14.84 TRINITY_DN584_c1_g1_i1:101-1018(-)
MSQVALSLLLLVVLLGLTHATDVPYVSPITGNEVTSGPSEPWNETETYKYLAYSGAAYCPKSQLEVWSCSPHCLETPNFEVTHYMNNTKKYLFGYAGVDVEDKTILFSFRGTSPGHLENWIVDLYIATTMPYKNSSSIRVHAGFYGGYLSMSSQIAAAYADLRVKFPTYALHVTGHSLGAALATLCAVDLADTYGENDITAYTYGLPRVGNLDFAAYYNALIPTSYRMTNQRDVVPHVPGTLLGFWHVQNEIWYNRTQEFVSCPLNNGEDPNCSESVPFWDTSIYEHTHYFGDISVSECTATTPF